MRTARESLIVLSLFRPTMYTSDRRQSKTLLTINEGGSKFIRNSIFDCHMSPVGQQMAMENSVSNDFCIYVR